MLKNLVLFTLFFCWLSPLSFTFLPISTGNISALIFMTYVFFEVIHKRLSSIFFYIIISAISVMVYYSAVTTFNGNYDYSLTYLLFLHIVQYSTGAYFFFSLIKKGNIKIDNIAFYLLLTGILLSFSSILSYLSFDFKLILSDILPQAGNIDPLRSNRVRGLSNSGGADHSMQLAICGIGYIFFYLKHSNAFLRTAIISLYCILMFSTVFIARTGFLVEMTIFLMAIILYDKNKLSTFFITVGSITLSLFCIIMFLPFIDYITNNVFSDETLPWFISLFSVITDGKVNDSNNDLLNMLYIPSDFSLLFFGSGGYEYFLGYNRSDSGYIKFIFSIGLVLSCLFAGFVAYSNFILFKKGRENKFFGILSLFIFMALLLNIKEPFLIKIGTVNMLYLALFFSWDKNSFRNNC